MASNESSIPAEKSRKRRGPPRSAQYELMREKVRALKATHTYRQIAALLGITHQMAFYYGRYQPQEEEKPCRSCGAPSDWRNKLKKPKTKKTK
jgi:hypothetical protein